VTTETRPNVEYGDPEIAYRNEILRTTVGSGVHGIAIAGTDDHDEMGVFVEPANIILGLDGPMDHFNWRTQPEGARSGPGDTDRIIYSLRKYLRLAVKGNPTALLPLFAPETDVLISTALGEELRSLRSSFLSVDAAERFLGYMHGQHERMMGKGRRSAVPNRPELIEKYGWDVKYGSHALRLAYQGRELVAHATLTLPMADAERERVLAVKRGEIPRSEVDEEITTIEQILLHLIAHKRTALPRHADLATLSAWSVQAHLTHWRTH
jgi:predicted nucleotidyltransferase